MIILNILILVVGFVFLIKGADLFVSGSSDLARNFRVPALIIGLTIVALGTSAPELAVSTSAAIQGSNEIAFSNVIGSNLFNLLAVLGVCSLFCPVPVNKSVMKRDFPLSIIITAIVLVILCSSVLAEKQPASFQMDQTVSTVSRLTGLLLVVLFVIYIGVLIVSAKKNATDEPDSEIMPVWKCALLIVFGLALIIGGGQAVVYSAKEIARAAGMTETLIGLTVVAIGTSLPELVTSVVAAKKGETELAVGNVIGSNLFNLMLILGISSLIHPVAVNTASIFDLAILLGVSVLTYIFALTKGRIGRTEGIILLLVYAGDMIFAIIR